MGKKFHISRARAYIWSLFKYLIRYCDALFMFMKFVFIYLLTFETTVYSAFFKWELGVNANWSYYTGLATQTIY